jgi:transcription antitermination factor NusG
MHWYAVYTLFRHEKKVVSELSEKGYEAYLPLITRVRKYKSRLKKYEVPLITSYVFIRTHKKKYVDILNIAGVIRLIKNDGKLSIIPDEEIKYLKMITGEIREIEANKLSASDYIGRNVMITEGPLFGIKAKVVDKRNSILIVELETIGYFLKFEIDPAILKFI